MVFPIEVGVILLGAADRSHWRISSPSAITSSGQWPRRSPGPLVTVVITAAAIWITAQPMDMRAVAFPG